MAVMAILRNISNSKQRRLPSINLSRVLFHDQNKLCESDGRAVSHAVKNAGKISLPQPPRLGPFFNLALLPQPYIIYQLQFDDFIDFKSFSKDPGILDE